MISFTVRDNSLVTATDVLWHNAFMAATRWADLPRFARASLFAVPL